MLESVVDVLPLALLPHIKTVLLVTMALLIVAALVAFLYLNRMITGVILVILVSALWVVTPEIGDRAEIRHFLAQKQSAPSGESASAAANTAGEKPLAQRLHVTYVGQSYVNIELDGEEKSLLPGDVYRGIQLFEVADGKAVFEINGQRISRSAPAKQDDR